MFAKEILLFSSEGRSHYRIPSVIVTKDGAVLAFCNDRKDTLADYADEVALVMAQKPLGGEWCAPRTLIGLEGWSCTIGSAVYDEEADLAICSFGRSPIVRHEFGNYTEEQLAQMERNATEQAERQGIEKGRFLLRSRDSGKTWEELPHIIEPYPFYRENDQVFHAAPTCHGAAHGIQLRHGTHRGRLLCPARFTTERYQKIDALQQCGFNNALYSDDHGETWRASAPVQSGTGEGTLIECGDGRILYNSRAYYHDGKRYLAVSRDGGETFGEFATDDFLQEEKGIGCNASFLRVAREELENQALLPKNADSVTVFVNPRSETRRNMTACVSFDSGKTWSLTKSIWEQKCAYSSLAFSAAEQRFYLLYEKGMEKNPYECGIAMLEFDLEWLLSKG